MNLALHLRYFLTLIECEPRALQYVYFFKLKKIIYIAKANQKVDGNLLEILYNIHGGH